MKWLILFVATLFAVFFIVQPTHAADWSQCRVESGTTQIDPSNTTKVLSPTTPIVDESKAFIIVDSSGPAAVAGADDHIVAGHISGGAMYFERGISTATAAPVSYSLIECFGDELFVQRGTVNLGIADFAGNAGLGTTVDTTRSMVTVSSYTLDPGATETTGLVTGKLITDVTISAERAVTGYDTVVFYQVIEFAKPVTVQSGEVTLGSGSVNITDLLGTSVDLDRSWIYCSWDASNVGIRQSAIGCELLNSDLASFYRYNTGAYTNRIRYYVIEFPSGSVDVERGSVYDNPEGTDGVQYDQDISISDVVDVQKAFPYVTNTANGTGTALPRNRWIEYLVGTTILRTSNWRTYTGGTADANTKYWQIIRFTPYYEALGWGWVGNAIGPADNATIGLVSFNCASLDEGIFGVCDDVVRNNYGVKLQYGGCRIECDVIGQAWVGGYDTGDSVPESPLGIIDFNPDLTDAPSVITGPDNGGTDIIEGDDPSTVENDSLDAHWNEETGELYGWARFRSLRDEEIALGGVANDWGWIKLRGKINDGASNEYGVTFDTDTLEFTGWAWNENGTNPVTGFESDGTGIGWVKFDIDLTSLVGTSFLETVQGDVYSKLGVSNSQTNPVGEHNATYLIETSGTVTDFTSELDINPPGSPEDYTPRENIDIKFYPYERGTNVWGGKEPAYIGNIYVNELITDAMKQDNDFVGPCTESILTGRTNPLDHQVFYCNGDLTINNNLTFYNAVADGNGSGTIVVNGDLNIRDNMTYFNNTISSHINNLASVSWIVLGEINIDPTVTEIVGAFIALKEDAGDPDLINFYTGYGNLPLEIYGLVMAKGYAFNRQDVGVSPDPKPAEKIIYDGRVIANTPPGLEDFSKVLPTIQ